MPDPLTVVCISDTHNQKLQIPPGDLLLHAGDLSNWGSFSEVQNQITWLSGQPHEHKVVIAGNHDLVLDLDFRSKYPDKWKTAQDAAASSDEDTLKTVEDIDWGNVTYLQDSTATLYFSGGRSIKVFGSPRTQQYGLSAFQYPPSIDPWTNKIPSGTDIVLVHGPPKGRLDGAKKAGCLSLAQEVRRVKPRLVVFGHIHFGYGIEEKVYDGAGIAHEEIQISDPSYRRLLAMVWSMLLSRCAPSKLRKTRVSTKFINAAVVEGWDDHKVKNKAVVQEI